ncbi:MAG: type II secretion system F family protein [Granulosicoccaceae bacterium]
MPRFKYNAIDKASHAVSGVMVAESELTLERQLIGNGLHVIDIGVESIRKFKPTTKVSRRELVDLFNGLTAMLEAGIDVSQCLDILTEETERAELKNVLSDIRLSVESGEALDEAMSAHPSIFGPEIRNLIKAGSHSGNLEKACADVAAHVEWVDKLMGDVKQATIYPAMVLAAVFSLILLMFLYVVPQFAEIFDALNLDLPWITLAVIAIGEFTVTYWWLILLAVALLAATLRYLPSLYPGFGVMLDRTKLKLPLFGPLILLLAQSRITHNLSLMLKAGVPIVDSLNLLAGVVGNRVVSQAVEESKHAVTEGRRMSEGLMQHKDIFTPMVMRMIVIGEESGRLDHCLAMISKRLDQEIPRKINRLFSVLEPLIIVSLIGVVGLIAAAIFMPLFDLMGGVMR